MSEVFGPKTDDDCRGRVKIYVCTWDTEAPAGISQMCSRMKCEGISIHITSVDERAMFFLLSIKEIRMFHGILRGTQVFI